MFLAVKRCGLGFITLLSGAALHFVTGLVFGGMGTIRIQSLFLWRRCHTVYRLGIPVLMPDKRILNIVVKHIANFQRVKIGFWQNISLSIEGASIRHETTSHRPTVVDRHIRTRTVCNETVVPCDRACRTRGALRFNPFPFWVYVKQFTNVYSNTDVIEAGCFMGTGEIPHASVRKRSIVQCNPERDGLP